MNHTYKAVEVSAPGALRVVERPIPEPEAAYARMVEGKARFRMVLTMAQ